MQICVVNVLTHIAKLWVLTHIRISAAADGFRAPSHASYIKGPTVIRSLRSIIFSDRQSTEAFESTQQLRKLSLLLRHLLTVLPITANVGFCGKSMSEEEKARYDRQYGG